MSGTADDPVARLKAGLDEDEQRARVRLNAGADRMSIAPALELRRVSAYREILAAYQPNGQGVAYTLEAGLEFAIKRLAAIYSDDAT